MTDIYHSGIKGQKKGVRRYQYLNGTYTREGNLRYRPPKNDSDRAAKRMIVGGVMGEVALMAAKHMQTANPASHPSILQMANTALSSVSSHATSIGKFVVEAVLKVPSPARAVTVSLLAIGTGVAIGNLIINGKDYVETVKNLPWKKVAHTTASIGASATGVALSTISANPLPAVAGLSISTLISALDKED